MLTFDPDIRDQAYQFFIQESVDFLQTLETGLMHLCEDHTIPRVHEIMRAAHSIKGGAASVGLEGIQLLAHQLEDCIRALYHDEVVVDAVLEDLMLRAFDCLQQVLMAQIETGQHDIEAALVQAEPIFIQLADRLGEAMLGDAGMPTTAELGVDIIQVIFAGDVNDGLLRLEQLLESAHSHELASEIRAQAEVFIGLGELVNLPGWVTIAAATITALQISPQQAQPIGRCAIDNLRTAQQGILAGDRTQGGVVCSELLSYGANPIVDMAVDELMFGPPVVDAFDDMFDDVIDDVFDAPIALDSSFSVDDFIVDDFDSLDAFFELELTAPQVEEPVELPIEPEPEPEPEPVAPVANPEAKSTSNANTESVRVDLVRLDRINNLVGELFTQENRVTLQGKQLQSAIVGITQRFEEFEGVAKQIGGWSDRSQKESAQLNDRRQAWNQLRTADPESLLETSLLQDLDPLQMDSYNGLYTLAQEMLELIAQMNEGMRDVSVISQQAQQSQRQQQQTLKLIREDLLWARMLPLSDLLQRFPRMLRDLSSKHGKQVQLKLTGAQTLVDKSILQSLYDPLVHLLRNAFDHGIESPEERLAQGKPAQATIEIRAYHRGNQTYIEIVDDGRGIDPEKIRSRLVDRDLLSVQEAQQLSTEEVHAYLFIPGFSTSDQVSELSGRGVGLDAVQLQMRNLKGMISLTSTIGTGTTFTLRLPLTLTIANLLVFSIESCLLALPIDTLQSIVAAPKNQIRNLRGERIFQWNDELVPICPARNFLQHYPLKTTLPPEFKAIPLPQDDKVTLLLMAVEGQLVALEVDQVLQEQELAIKPFSKSIPHPAYFYGCTILGNGLLVPVLDSQALAAPVDVPTTSVTPPPPSSQDEPDRPAHDRRLADRPLPDRTIILVVDDSLTTRQTLALTLQKAGYHVLQAKDGREGLEQLQRESGIKAVFSDIEMPRMNGFEFLSQCRLQYPKDQLPVFMLTSRGGDRHRQIAQYMGANGYLTKPYLEPEVLNALAFLHQKTVAV
jgi:two-component system, chemotaxis family, sensor histidine kinase and response regulator PixL